MNFDSSKVQAFIRAATEIRKSYVTLLYHSPAEKYALERFDAALADLTGKNKTSLTSDFPYDSEGREL